MTSKKKNLTSTDQNYKLNMEILSSLKSIPGKVVNLQSENFINEELNKKLQYPEGKKTTSSSISKVSKDFFCDQLEEKNMNKKLVTTNSVFKPEELRKAYKHLALKFHPDKKQNEIIEQQEDENLNETLNYNENLKEKSMNECTKDKEISEDNKDIKTSKQKEINERWLKIKTAYETLIDEDKRKKYDSTIEVDDSIPDADVIYSEEEFYDTFGPVFLKNSIWSKKKPVPKLGDSNTPLEKVKKFINFGTIFRAGEILMLKENMI